MKPTKIYLNKTEVNSLKDFCDDNLEVGIVEISQNYASGIGRTTMVQVKDLPETRTSITDIDAW